MSELQNTKLTNVVFPFIIKVSILNLVVAWIHLVPLGYGEPPNCVDSSGKMNKAFRDLEFRLML